MRHNHRHSGALANAKPQGGPAWAIEPGISMLLAGVQARFEIPGSRRPALPRNDGGCDAAGSHDQASLRGNITISSRQEPSQIFRSRTDREKSKANSSRSTRMCSRSASSSSSSNDATIKASAPPVPRSGSPPRPGRSDLRRRRRCELAFASSCRAVNRYRSPAGWRHAGSAVLAGPKWCIR